MVFVLLHFVESRIIIFILILTGFTVNAQFYNGSQLEFGKNRIQYKPLDWSFYRYDRFDVFFYAGGKDLSHLTAKIAKTYLPELESRFDYTLQNRLQLLIFDRLSDLKQSNVGIDASLANNLGGVTRQVGNKILLYNENGTVDFVKQIHAGIAEALVSEFLYGNDFRERLRSATLLNIPDWYLKGLVAWLSDSWNTQIENRVRDGIISGRYMQFNRLTGVDAVMAGQSIWHYIAATYGEKVIPEILEVTRINRSVESGFQYVLGIGLKGINQEWLNYYDKKYFYNDTLFDELSGSIRSGKYREGYIYHQPQISPDGNSVAWVRNDHGKNTVWLAPFEGGKNRKLFTSGRKLPTLNDQSFPQLAWHPTGEYLIYSDEFKGRLRLNFYNIKSKKTERKFLNGLEKVISMDVSPNGLQIALTGIRDGKTDVYIFSNAANTLQNITDDFWDEANPRWLPNGKSIIFSSNRPHDSLGVQQTVPLIPPTYHDLFIFNLATPLALNRLTATPFVNELQAFPFASNQITYLSDENGISNRYAARFDSAIAFVDTAVHYRHFIVSRPLTNYKRGILEQSVSLNGKVAELVFSNGRQAVYTLKQADLFGETTKLPNTVSAKQRVPVNKVPVQKKTEPTGSPKVKKIVVFGEDRQKNEGKNGESGQLKSESPVSDTLANPDSFRLSRQRLYETAYYSDYLVTQIDRGFLNQTYQSYSGQAGFINPSLNGLFKIGLSDLFDNYKITGGIRLSANLTGNEYLLAFQDLKKRWDKIYVFHRQGVQK
jgi:Tol biopolymer transport system component